MAQPNDTYDGYTVLPNESSLLIGLLASGVLMLAFLGAPGAWRLIGVLLFLVFAVCLLQIFRPTPIVRATRQGLFLSIGTFGRSFYVPWERVDAVILAEVASLPGPNGTVTRDALGFVIRQGDGFRLPALRFNCAGEDLNGTPSDIRFESTMIQGDVKTWVRKLEAFRKDVRHLPD
ncbi:MAG: hypothetical protein ACLPHP_02400 [Candidatus Sulfotelmatobacter sp.]